MSELVSGSLGRNPKLERQLEADTQHTHKLLDDYQKSGRRIKVVRLSEESLRHHPQQDDPTSGRLTSFAGSAASSLARLFATFMVAFNANRL